MSYGCVDILPEVASSDDANFDVVPTGMETTGRWTKPEHLLFLEGLKMYGKEWKKVAAKVKPPSPSPPASEA